MLRSREATRKITPRPTRPATNQIAIRTWRNFRATTTVKGLLSGRRAQQALQASVCLRHDTGVAAANDRNDFLLVMSLLLKFPLLAPSGHVVVPREWIHRGHAQRELSKDFLPHA